MKNFKLRRATLLLALTVPSFCWGYLPSLNALIVNDGTTGLELDVTTNNPAPDRRWSDRALLDAQTAERAARLKAILW
jgi:hypothetical protein